MPICQRKPTEKYLWWYLGSYKILRLGTPTMNLCQTALHSHSDAVHDLKSSMLCNWSYSMHNSEQWNFTSRSLCYFSLWDLLFCLHVLFEVSAWCFVRGGINTLTWFLYLHYDWITQVKTFTFVIVRCKLHLNVLEPECFRLLRFHTELVEYTLELTWAQAIILKCMMMLVQIRTSSTSSSDSQRQTTGPAAIILVQWVHCFTRRRFAQ